MHSKMKAESVGGMLFANHVPFTGRLSADREIKVLDARSVRIIKSLTCTGTEGTKGGKGQNGGAPKI